MARWRSRVLLTLSTLLAVAAMLALVAPNLRGGEKPDAVEFAGHWWDLRWEIALPLSMGAFALLAVTLSRRAPAPWRAIAVPQAARQR